MSRETWKSGLLGFLSCALLTLALYLWLHFGAPGLAEAEAPDIAKQFGEPEPEVRIWLIGHSRMVARDGALSLLIPLAIYWAISSAFGKGAIVRLASANALLMAGVAGQVLLLLNAYYGWANTYCDVMPFPHEGFQIRKIDECPSSATFFSALSQVSFWMLIASLGVRIAMSRRQGKHPG